jgi:uncharacterized protein YcfL
MKKTIIVFIVMIALTGCQSNVKDVKVDSLDISNANRELSTTNDQETLIDELNSIYESFDELDHLLSISITQMVNVLVKSTLVMQTKALQTMSFLIPKVLNLF